MGFELSELRRVSRSFEVNGLVYRKLENSYAQYPVSPCNIFWKTLTSSRASANAWRVYGAPKRTPKAAAVYFFKQY